MEQGPLFSSLCIRDKGRGVWHILQPLAKLSARTVLDYAGMGLLRSDRCIAASSLWASGTVTSWNDVLVSFLRASLMTRIYTAAFFFSSLPHFCPRISLSCFWKPLFMIQRAHMWLYCGVTQGGAISCFIVVPQIHTTSADGCRKISL